MLITRRISFLQSIQKAASNGYFYYTSGKVQAEKLDAFIKKIQHVYLLNQSTQQCWRRKKKGLANAKFFVYPCESDPSGLSFFWVLMLTAGKHIAYEKEHLKDLRQRKTRLIFSNYQLVQKPNATGKESFTFKLTGEAFDYYLDNMRKAVRSKQRFNINRWKIQIEKLSGFSGVRLQRKQIIQHYRAEIKRAFRDDEVEEFLAFNNWYSRQMSVDSVKNVSLFIQSMQEHNLTAKQQLKRYFENKRVRKPKKQTQKIAAKPKNIFSGLLEKMGG